MLNSKIKLMAMVGAMAMTVSAGMDAVVPTATKTRDIKISMQFGNHGVGLSAGYQIKPWLSMHIIGDGFAIKPSGQKESDKKEWANMWSIGAQPRVHMFSGFPAFYVGAHIGYAGLGGKYTRQKTTGCINGMNRAITAAGVEGVDATKLSLKGMKLGLTTGYSFAISQSMGVGFNPGLFSAGKSLAKLKEIEAAKGKPTKQMYKTAFGNDDHRANMQAFAKFMKSNGRAFASHYRNKNAKGVGKAMSYSFDMFGQRFQPKANISFDMSF